MRVLLLSIMFSPVICSAQKKLDEYTAKNGIKYEEKDTVHLGRGSAPNGEFLYLQMGGWAAALGSNSNKGPDQNNIGRGYANTAVIIKSIKKYKIKGVEKIYFVVGGGNITNYYLSIEEAIEACEVTPCPKEEPRVVINNNTPSLADELAKLKKLFDDGALTKDEYDAAKKKLIEKQ